MGAGGSTLTEADVDTKLSKYIKEDTLNDTLNSYSKKTDLISYSKKDDLLSYLNKSTDKATDLTDATNSKWVSPKWVSSSYVKTSDLSNYSKKDDLSNYSKKDDLLNYLNKSTDKATLNVASGSPAWDSSYVTPKWVDAKMSIGSISPSAVAANLALNADFTPIISGAIAESDPFQSGVAQNLATIGSFRDAMWSKLRSDEGSNFRSSLIESMAGDARFRGPQGPSGTFNSDSIKRNLWNGTSTGEGNKVLWCADGDLCQVPAIKKGIQFTTSGQLISGYGATTTSPKVVSIDDNIALKNGGEIGFARDWDREDGSTSMTKLGTNDAKIRAYLPVGDTSDVANASGLEIYGVGKLPSGASKRVSRKIKMYDDVDISGNLTVNGSSGNFIDLKNWVRIPGAKNTPAGSGDMMTHFNHQDGNNYIRGNTYISGKIGVDEISTNKINIGKFSLQIDPNNENRMYITHPNNPGQYLARISATDWDRLRWFADQDGNKGKYFFVNQAKASGIADIGPRWSDPNGV